MNSSTPPNVLFILSDDHAAHAISAYTDAGFGPDIIRTPHLDRLAREGVRADNCFCTNSICTPSRASILTGQHTHVCNVRTLADTLDNRYDPQMQKLFKKAGYRTSMFGKWHLGHGARPEELGGGNADPAGFDDWAVLPDQGDYYDPKFYMGNVRGRQGTLHTEGYVTDITTDFALDWLNRWREDFGGNDSASGAKKPFFCCLHNKAPHRTWQPGPEEQSLFRGEDMEEPETFWDDYATRPAAAAARMRVDRDMHFKDVKAHPPAGLSEPDRKRWYYDRYIKDYLRCCAGIDRNIGRVLDWLDENGLADNTIVVYTSDQGFFLGDHGWFDKRFIYEHSIRMPLLIRYPERLKPETTTDAILTNVDFAPTLLELAGLEAPAEMQGSSFAPILETGEEPEDWQQSFYYRYWMHGEQAHYTTAHYGVRTRTHKLTYFYADPLGTSGSGIVNTGVEPYWELFDLTADRNELKNIYGEPGTEEVTKELIAELDRLQEHFADTPMH